MEAAGREPFGRLVPPPPSAPHQVELRLRQTTYWDVTTSCLPLTRSSPACGRAPPWDTEQMKGLLLSDHAGLGRADAADSLPRQRLNGHL